MKEFVDVLGTKKRLTEWGNWCYKITTMGLRYSNKSLIAKFQEEEGVVIQGTAKMLAPTNEQGEEINNLVEKLAEQKPQGLGKPELAKILCIHYTMPNKDIADRIRSTSLARATYYRYLRDGEEWLSQYLAFH